MIIRTTLQFYADKPKHYENRLFTFQVNENIDCFRILLKFAVNGNLFRKAWKNTHAIEPNKKTLLTSDELTSFVQYFNRCEYDKAPTLQEAIYDYKMFYDLWPNSLFHYTL